jgi:hypothetical protein
VRFAGSGEDITGWSGVKEVVNSSVTTAIWSWTFAGAEPHSRGPANQAVSRRNAGRSSQEVLDQGFFLQEFGHRGIDLVTAEIVQANIWHDFAARAGGADRE